MGNSRPATGVPDLQMWQGMEQGELRLQCCDACGQFRYPAASHCAHCLDDRATWKAAAGKGVVLSWVVFHRQYFDDFPPPYNCIAVRLDEGPILITTLKGRIPSGNWIGHRVSLAFGEQSGRMQHHAVLAAPE